MKPIISKSGLAVILSKLEGFEQPSLSREQYSVDSELAATILWNATLLGDIEGKVIADLGCGTGILGIGALLLGASCVIFVDDDENALNIAKKNLLKVKSEGSCFGTAEFVCQDIKDYSQSLDVVIQNPPFGTKVRHSDIKFLGKALSIAPVVYSLHKSENNNFLEQFASKNNARITHIWNCEFPLKAAFEFHRRKIHRIDVSCLRFVRLNISHIL